MLYASGTPIFYRTGSPREEKLRGALALLERRIDEASPNTEAGRRQQGAMLNRLGLVAQYLVYPVTRKP